MVGGGRDVWHRPPASTPAHDSDLSFLCRGDIADARGTRPTTDGAGLHTATRLAEFGHDVLLAERRADLTAGIRTTGIFGLGRRAADPLRRPLVPRRRRPSPAHRAVVSWTHAGEGPETSSCLHDTTDLGDDPRRG
jgi:hypothetical protein